MAPEDLPPRPVLIFDGECSFCRAWAEYWKSLTQDRVDYLAYQEIDQRFPRLSREQLSSAVRILLPDGDVRSGAHAVFTLLDLVPGKGWALRAYHRVAGFAWLSEVAYRAVARHRSFAYRVTNFLWGIPLRQENYRLSGWLFLRLLGAIYLIAFASFGVQASGLIGSHGIQPVSDYLHALQRYFGVARYWNAPTLLWLSASDGFLRSDWIAGVCLSVLVLAGMNWRVFRIVLFALYLSLVTAGQVFMSYQWDALLLEAGSLAIFLGSSPVIARLFRWLLFRLIFLSGAVKLVSRDPSWHNFTALPVHYETQPLPTPPAWYFYQLPAWFQRMSVGFVFFVELVVPFLILAPRRIRHFAALAITTLQVLIIVTGNYAFFNLLTISLCLFLLDDTAMQKLLPSRIWQRIPSWFHGERWPRLRRAFYPSFAAFILFVSGFEMLGMFSRVHWAPADGVIHAVGPFEIVNTYGLFAVMTTSRPEIVVEGSNDGQTWLAYEFKYKPGELMRRPPWVAPHQPRLDWQMWFAALGSYESDPWIVHFVARLLEGSPDVLRLLARNPFPNAPPRYIRAQLYDYSFTTSAEKKATGNWWQRNPRQLYLPPVTLRSP